jgi:hypothetical protein
MLRDFYGQHAHQSWRCGALSAGTAAIPSRIALALGKAPTVLSAGVAAVRGT